MTSGSMKIDVFIRLISRDRSTVGGAVLRSRSRSVMSFRSGADMCDLLNLAEDILGELDIHLLYGFLLASLLTTVWLVGKDRVTRSPCLTEDDSFREVKGCNR